MTLIPSGSETNAEYHASGAWGSSRINDSITSPQIAYLRLIGDLPHEMSRALTLGQALHGRFDGSYSRDFAAGPDVSSRRTKTWQQAQAADPDRTLLTPSEVQVLDWMEQSVRENPYARALVDGAETEVGVRRASPYGRYRLQCRIDLLQPGQHLIDIKTTSNLDDFGKSVRRYGYHRQAAFYRWLYDQEVGCGLLPWSFIVVESQRPCRSRVIDLEPAWLDQGWQEVERTLIEIGRRYQTGDWRDPQHQLLEAPRWMPGAADPGAAA